MKHARKQWQLLIAFFGIVMGMMFSMPVVMAKNNTDGNTVLRPIEDFLAAQGTYCIADGMGGCLLFVPPDPNFLGWNSEFDSPPVLFAGVDYAGLAEEAYNGNLPQMSGTVTERPLKDGRAEVTVLLHTKNANAWVIELDLSGDLLDQVANKPTLFGHRPYDVSQGAGQALGDSFLHVDFINDSPGALLPDLIQLVNFPTAKQELKFMGFSTNAKGPLTSEFGVAEGTPGKCTVAQTGLFMTHGKGQALADSFPAEDIHLRAIGR
jgi:hypothetical protein